MRRRVHLLLCAVCLACLPPPARASDPVLQETVGLAGVAMFLDSGAPGMVLVLVRGPDALVTGYGETTKGNGKEPDGQSLFRLGSVTKIFAAELLADLADDGKLRLGDPLQRFAPAGVTVPTAGDRPITLLDLATHSAGLPREIGPVPPGLVPFTWPDKAQRWAFLAGYKLPWAPGTVAAYSNVGFDFLADAVEAASGQDYPSLLRDRITAPLGMADTGLQPGPGQCARLMTGSGIAGPGPCGDTTATEGSGGLYSTGDDMAKFLRHLAASDGAASWPALAVARAMYRPRQAMTAAIGFDEAGPMAGLGLGWVIQAAHGTAPLIVEKSGGGGGFMSYLAFIPGRQVGVFVAVSRVDFAMFYGLTTAANGLLAELATR